MDRPVSLASDEWAHPGALHEWWYVNAHLRDGRGRAFGLVVSLFPDYLLAALVDRTEGRTLFSQVARGRRLRAAENGVSLEGASLTGGPDGYSLSFDSPDGSARLSLRPTKTPLLVGGRGKIREGLLGDSWYYALTNMAAEGELSFQGLSPRVAGVGWLDRQWGSWDDMGIGGWQWFSLQFEDGREMLATEIYSPVTMRACTRIMSVKLPDSSEAHTSRFALRRTAVWRSPATGCAYGRGWTISMPGGSSVEVTADFDSQELHRGLWEGACTAVLSEGAKATNGVGYAEQVDRSLGGASRAISVAAAPLHYFAQKALRRANIGGWDLLERLGVWRLSTKSR